MVTPISKWGHGEDYRVSGNKIHEKECTERSREGCGAHMIKWNVLAGEKHWIDKIQSDFRQVKFNNPSRKSGCVLTVSDRPEW